MAYYLERSFTNEGEENKIYYQQITRNDGNGVMDTIWTDEYNDKTTLSTLSAAQTISSKFTNAQIRTV